MSTFTDTFSKPGTRAQTVTTDGFMRGVGFALKAASLFTLSAVAASTGVAPVAAIAAVAISGVGYLAGAASGAQGTKVTNKQGNETSFVRKTLRNLNPIKG